jgi:hypothetical protein
MAKAERGTRETFNREPRTGATLGAGAASTSAPRRGGAWNRDEWEVALADGAVYRIFRDHATDAWFIDGVID